MAASHEKTAGCTPPPPLPRRVLNYEPPYYLPPPQPSAKMNAYAGNLSAASPRAGLGASSVPPSAVDYYGHASPTSPATNSQQYQHVSTPGGANATRPFTSFFYDHSGHLTSTVFLPELHHSISTMYSPSGTPTAGSSTLATIPKTPAPRSDGRAAHDSNGKCETTQITIQLYFHSVTSPSSTKTESRPLIDGVGSCN